jgi:hypothetical protein
MTILPSFNRKGGYDTVNVRVEIERPLVGIGSTLGKEKLHEERDAAGEILSARAATLADLRVDEGGPFIPTETKVFPLYDDGTHGDLHAGNGTWSANLPDLARVDGMYQLHFIFEGTVGSCTTRREMFQSLFVEVAVDPRASGVQVGQPNPTTGIRMVSVTPQDKLGNLWGPGRAGTVACNPTSACNCNTRNVVDHGDGRYSIPVALTSPDALCRIDAFGTRFVLNQVVAASLALQSETTTSDVGAEFHLTAKVLDGAGNPVGDQTVEFRVSGVHNSRQGSATTNDAGEASFGFTGFAPGVDTIRAWVDENGNGLQDAGEPSGTQTHTWVELQRILLPFAQNGDTELREHETH